WLRQKRLDDFEACCRAERHPDCDTAVQLHYRRWCALCKRRVERGDVLPVGFFRRVRSCVTCRDRCLQRVPTVLPAEPLGALERSETTANEQLIPTPAILIEQENGLTGRPHAGARARRLDLHQRDETVHLRHLWNELGQDAPQT